MREAQYNGNAAALFFLQTVGIDTGQSVHQCGLAMIHVADNADDAPHASNEARTAAAMDSRSESSTVSMSSSSRPSSMRPMTGGRHPRRRAASDSSETPDGAIATPKLGMAEPGMLPPP